MYPRPDAPGVRQAGGGQPELRGGQVAEAGDLRGRQLLGHHRADQVELEAECVSGTQSGGQLVHLHVGSSQPGRRGEAAFREVIIRETLYSLSVLQLAV